MNFACQHCGMPLTKYRDNSWRDRHGGSSCLRSPSKKHEPSDVPYTGLKGKKKR